MPNRKADELKSSFASLEKALKEHKRDLEVKENELEREREALQNEKAAFGCGSAKPSDVLHLNVGGTKMAVLRRTLTTVPSSMLASRFSGRWDENLEKDRDGNFFIDQPFHLFEAMVNYLRDKSNETPDEAEAEPPKVVGDMKKLYRMISYYGMTLSTYPVKVSFLRGDEDCAEIVQSQVTSEFLRSFHVLPQGHNRSIRSFEVTVTNAQQIKVGWHDSQYVNPLEDDLGDEGDGIGDHEGSIALDPSSGILQDGEKDKIEGLQLNGAVIRTEDFGSRWFVNGQLVASNNVSDSVLVVTPFEYLHREPIISIQGECHISDVSYSITD